MSGTFDDVTAEQPTDTRLDNDAPWSAVKQRVTEKLAEAAEIFDAAETIHEWDDLDAWDAEYTGRARRSRSSTPTARGFGSARGSVTDGFNVHTSTGAERAVPQRARSSRRSATSIASIGV